MKNLILMLYSDIIGYVQWLFLLITGHIITGNQIFPHRCAIAGVFPFAGRAVDVDLFHDAGQQGGRIEVAVDLLGHPLELLHPLPSYLELTIIK